MVKELETVDGQANLQATTNLSTSPGVFASTLEEHLIAGLALTVLKVPPSLQ